MSNVEISVNVPAELSNIANLAQSLVSDLAGGKNWMSVLSGAMPILFAEGLKIDELKAEVKQPAAITLAGLVLGGIAAKLVQQAMDAKAAAPAAAAVQPSQVVAPQPGDSAQA